MPELVRFLEEIPMRSSTHKLAEQLTEEGLPPDTLGVARAERLAQVSKRVREESMRVNAEFAAIDRDVDEASA